MQINHLSSRSIEVLQKLIGEKVHTIWAPNLDAAGAHLAAWTLSMLMAKERFINFACDWSETPKLLNDSWLIRISEDKEPINIKKNDGGAFLDVCTISIFAAPHIERIEIFEHLYQPEGEKSEEWVRYDQALVFRCTAERNFCICCMLNGPGVATYLHFSEAPEVIAEMISNSQLRATIQ